MIMIIRVKYFCPQYSGHILDGIVEKFTRLEGENSINAAICLSSIFRVRRLVLVK